MDRRRPLIALTAVLLFGGVFVLLPALAAQLNEQLSLPRWRVPLLQGLGLALMLAAVLVYGYCAALFSRLGSGTTSPLAPPQRLVESGLFACSRNPIYVGYIAFLLGVFLWFGHAALLVYASLVAASIHVFIVYWEEPDLHRRFGTDYGSYCSAVPRWLGRPRRSRGAA